MPIESITGKPGNAKTAFLVKRIMQAAEKAERPLWAAGIDGLKPGFCSIFKDPKEWNAVKPGETCTCHDTDDSSACDAHVIPNGSLIFIDEAWKWFGHLQDAARQATPAHVLALAEHRHRGIDFVWTYQQPSQIFPFARGLMAEHYHLVRKFGTMFCDQYHWQELCEDVKSQSKRDAAQKSTVAIPKETFGLYKSAEVHTIKRKIPGKVLALPALLVAAAVLLYFGIGFLKPDAMASRMSGTAPSAAQAAPGQGVYPGGVAQELPVRHATDFEYAKMHLPRFASMPWTAPVYDQREAIADPEIYCMASGAGLDAQGVEQPASCTCLTEQGTHYAIAAPECRTLASNGPVYNPYGIKRNQPESGGGQWQGEPRQEQRAVAVGVGEPTFRAQQARYGQMRRAEIPADYKGSKIYSGGGQ